MKATDLRQALNVLDPQRALQTEEQLRDWFVARPGSPIDDLRMLLEDSIGPQKILFTGHIGSGKSTELAKLSQQLSARFFIVRYSVQSVLNLFDLTYVDVVLSLGLQLIREATKQEQRIRVREDVLKQILQFGKDISRDTEMGDTSRTELGAELSFFFGKLAGKLGAEAETRQIVRERVSHRIGDLLENTDILAKEIKKATGREPLVVVEDLDKTALRTAKELFYENATSLLAPPLSVIYTFPTALRHDDDVGQIRMSFPSIYVLPNLKVHSRDGERDEDGLVCLRGILNNRLEEGLIVPEALDRLAELSSGIPRELITLSRQASLEARKSRKLCIEVDDVEAAAHRVRMEYQVLLTSKQIDLLRRVHRDKRVENDDDHRALLHNISALEYRNDVVWHDVHPLILPLLCEGA